MKQKKGPRKVLATRTGRRMAYCAIVALALASCTAQQKISVKQSQGDQQQETTIEHGGNIKELSLHFIASPQVNYPTALVTPNSVVYASNEK